MKKGEIALIILIFVVAIGLTCFRTSSETQEIKEWVALRGDSATLVDYKAFNTGPYWYDKNSMVYRVETRLGNIYWIRYRWGRTIYQETSPGQYTEIED